jgi:DNA-binding MarR family transcriptional regulator
MAVAKYSGRANVKEAPVGSTLARPSDELPRSVEPSHHEELLHEAVRRLLVLRQVMRLAVQEVRSELPASDLSREATPGESVRGGPAGFGDTQFHILKVLSESPSLAVGEIADRCHVADPTISKMLNHLEANGLIERRIDKTNRRVVRVLLTAAGRAAEAAMGRRFETALARVLSPLADGELGDLIAAFGHLQRLVGAPAGLDGAPCEPSRDRPVGEPEAGNFSQEASNDDYR